MKYLAMAMLLTVLANPVAAASRASPLHPGDRYVAMGSSFAAGPGVTTSADTPANRCARSRDNYARQVARKRGFTLVDVSCSGATTADILRGSATIPAQIEAVTADTRLVTVTIGGNDVGYIGALGGASCRLLGTDAQAPGGRCPDAHLADEAQWAALKGALEQVAREVRRRAPSARLLFVDYVSVLPETGGCKAAPLPAADAKQARATAARLAQLTAAVAKDTGSTLVRVSSLSRGHDACAADPWVTGFPQPGGAFFVPYHPNLAGMTAVASAIDRTLH